MGTGWKCFEVHNRKSQDCPEESADKNIEIKGHFGQDSDKNNE